LKKCDEDLCDRSYEKHQQKLMEIRSAKKKKALPNVGALDDEMIDTLQ
jgi:hypothetical protein